VKQNTLVAPALQCFKFLPNSIFCFAKSYYVALSSVLYTSSSLFTSVFFKVQGTERCVAELHTPDKKALSSVKHGVHQQISVPKYGV
jgi:hypothetical protein